METKYLLTYISLLTLCAPQQSKGMDKAPISSKLSCVDPTIPHGPFSPSPISSIINRLNDLNELIEFKYSQYKETLSKVNSEQQPQNLLPNPSALKSDMNIVYLGSLQDSPESDVLSALFNPQATTTTAKDLIRLDITTLLELFSPENKELMRFPEDFDAFYKDITTPINDLKISPEKKRNVLKEYEPTYEKFLSSFFQYQFSRLTTLLNIYKSSIKTYYNNDLFKKMLKYPKVVPALVSPFFLQEIAEEIQDWQAYFELCGSEALTYYCAELIQNFYIHLKQHRQHMPEKIQKEWTNLTKLIEDFAFLNRPCTKPERFPIYGPDTTLAAQLLNQNAQHKIIPSIIPAFYDMGTRTQEFFQQLDVHYKLSPDAPLEKKWSYLKDIANILAKYKAEKSKDAEEITVYLSFPEYPVLDPIHFYNFVTQRKKISIPFLSDDPNIFNAIQQRKNLPLPTTENPPESIEKTQTDIPLEKTSISLSTFQEEPQTKQIHESILEKPTIQLQTPIEHVEQVKHSLEETKYDPSKTEAIDETLLKTVCATKYTPNIKIPPQKQKATYDLTTESRPEFSDRPSLNEIAALATKAHSYFNSTNYVESLVDKLLSPSTNSFKTKKFRTIIEFFNGKLQQGKGTSHFSIYTRDNLSIELGLTLHGKSTIYEGEKGINILRKIFYKFLWKTLYGNPYA